MNAAPAEMVGSGGFYVGLPALSEPTSIGEHYLDQRRIISQKNHIHKSDAMPSTFTQKLIYI
jgi:hypothetical protein